MQAYSGAQALQMIIFLATGNNKGGGYFASRSAFLCMYMGFTIIWAVLNSFALQVIAFLDIISICVTNQRDEEGEGNERKAEAWIWILNYLKTIALCSSFDIQFPVASRCNRCHVGTCHCLYISYCCNRTDNEKYNNKLRDSLPVSFSLTHWTCILLSSLKHLLPCSYLLPYSLCFSPLFPKNF